jgi:hypothetical protein
MSYEFTLTCSCGLVITSLDKESVDEVNKTVGPLLKDEAPFGLPPSEVEEFKRGVRASAKSTVVTQRWLKHLDADADNVLHTAEIMVGVRVTFPTVRRN